MSTLQAECYSVVRHLVTDVRELSKEERNHVLWYACDVGNLSMAKSVIRAGCDVDHFHRGHTPLMMASIRGHDDVVKELILAGCNVDLRSKGCFVGWFRFITKIASAWPALVAWAVVILIITMVINIWVQQICYWLIVLTVALHFLNEESFNVSGMLRMKSWTRFVAWVGIVSATALIWRLVAGTEANALMALTVLMAVTVLVIVMVLMAVTGVGIVTLVKVMANRRAGTVASVVAVAVSIVGIVLQAWIGAGMEALAINNISIGPDTVGKVVAVTVILALALTVAMAGAGAVPFAVASIMTVTVAMAGVWGLALGDAFFRSAVGQMTRIPIPPIVMVALAPIGAIMRMSTLSVTGTTALHYAAWYNHITCGIYLVEAGANMLAENKYFRTPSHICSRMFKAAVEQAQSFSPKRVIAVIGNTEYGKSTLIAALQSESRTFFQRLVYKCAQVCNITKRTAGIEAVPFCSAKYGEILFYDFAGQSDYHGPHQPFLEAMLGKPGLSVSLLLLVKVTEGQDVITQQLIRWLQPVALASVSSTPEVIVVGSYLDQAKSKKLVNVKLQRCINFVQEYPSLKVQGPFLLDCREPNSAGIKGLRRYLQQTQPLRSTLPSLSYNIHWVLAQLQKEYFCKQSLQLNAFEVWLQDNAHSLPTNLPPPEDVCQDLSAAGCILFLRNKQDLSQSWLILDLQTILHNVYGTLFCPDQDRVNQFGLLQSTRLSELFTKLVPKLDPKMVQEVLITLEFCITVDPLLLKEEMLSLTEKDEVDGWLYFPALVSAKAHEVFAPDPQCLHWACWQLKTDDKHIILAHLLQGIILGIAATQVFIEKDLPPSVRKHCCSVWVNGLSWGSTTGVDVAVQISDGSVVTVIGRSKVGPGKLYRYMSNVTQCIFQTIAKLSPALKTTPYVIHPYTHIGLDEAGPSSPATRFPVASIIRSIEAGHQYVHSQPIVSGTGSKIVSLQELFGGWSPSLCVVQCLNKTQSMSPDPQLPSSSNSRSTRAARQGAVMRLDSKPTARSFDELVCRRVASNWDQLALHLDVEPHVIRMVREDNPYNCERASRDVFFRWLNGERGTGTQQRTWRSILSALRESGEQELAGRLRTECFV